MSAPVNTVTRDEIILNCTVDLFQAYDVAVEPAPQPVAESVTHQGIIGFTGEPLQGTLVIGATSSLMSLPQFAASTSEAWMSELANQLIGRIKNRLLRFDVLVHLSTPVAVCGSSLSTQTNHHGAQPYYLHSRERPHAGLTIWFDVPADAPTEFSVAEGEEVDVPEEGEMLMF